MLRINPVELRRRRLLSKQYWLRYLPPESRGQLNDDPLRSILRGEGTCGDLLAQQVLHSCCPFLHYLLREGVRLPPDKKGAEERNIFASLNDDCIAEILSFCGQSELCYLAITSKRLRACLLSKSYLCIIGGSSFAESIETSLGAQFLGNVWNQRFAEDLAALLPFLDGPELLHDVPNAAKTVEALIPGLTVGIRCNALQATISEIYAACSAALSSNGLDTLAVVLAAVLELGNGLGNDDQCRDGIIAAFQLTKHRGVSVVDALRSLKSRFNNDYTGIEHVLVRVYSVLGGEDTTRRRIQSLSSVLDVLTGARYHQPGLAFVLAEFDSTLHRLEHDCIQAEASASSFLLPLLGLVKPRLVEVRTLLREAKGTFSRVSSAFGGEQCGLSNACRDLVKVLAQRAMNVDSSAVAAHDMALEMTALDELVEAAALKSAGSRLVARSKLTRSEDFKKIRASIQSQFEKSPGNEASFRRTARVREEISEARTQDQLSTAAVALNRMLSRRSTRFTNNEVREDESVGAIISGDAEPKTESYSANTCLDSDAGISIDEGASAGVVTVSSEDALTTKRLSWQPLKPPPQIPLWSAAAQHASMMTESANVEVARLLFSCGVNISTSGLAPKPKPRVFSMEHFCNCPSVDAPTSTSKTIPEDETPKVVSLAELREVVATGKCKRGLKRACLETYLSDSEFEVALGMAREAFLALPQWRRQARKKKAGLF